VKGESGAGREGPLYLDFSGLLFVFFRRLIVSEGERAFPRNTPTRMICFDLVLVQIQRPATWEDPHGLLKSYCLF